MSIDMYPGLYLAMEPHWGMFQALRRLSVILNEWIKIKCGRTWAQDPWAKSDSTYKQSWYTIPFPLWNDETVSYLVFENRQAPQDMKDTHINTGQCSSSFKLTASQTITLQKTRNQIR